MQREVVIEGINHGRHSGATLERQGAGRPGEQRATASPTASVAGAWIGRLSSLLALGEAGRTAAARSVATTWVPLLIVGVTCFIIGVATGQLYFRARGGVSQPVSGGMIGVGLPDEAAAAAVAAPSAADTVVGAGSALSHSFPREVSDDEQSYLSCFAPEWLAQSDAEWLNALLSCTWPRINAFLRTMVETQIQPSIDAAVPSVLKGCVRFEQCDLGQARPRLGPITVREREQNAITIDVGTDITLDVNVSISALAVRLGIQSLVFRGTLTVVLRPPRNKPPFFGGLEVYAADPPEIDFDLTGLGNIADCPGIAGIVRSTVVETVSRSLVLPARVAVDLDNSDDVDSVDMQFPEPLGILRLTLKSARGLPAADTSLFGFGASSDPYVLAQLGQESWQSPVKARTLAPVWRRDNVADFPVHDTSQHLRISVYDQDLLSRDDLLGSARLPVGSLARGGQAQDTEFSLLDQGKTAGLVTISTRWLTLRPGSMREMERTATALGGPAQILLLGKLVGAGFLPEDARPPFTVRMAVGEGAADREALTRPSRPGPGAAPTAELLHEVCAKLEEQGMPEEQICAVSGLSPQQVRKILHARTDPEAAAHAAQEAAKLRAIREPIWHEVVSVLLPWDRQMRRSSVSLELRDRGGNRIGEVFKTPLAGILAELDSKVQGPFPISPDIGLEGSLSAMWFQPA